MAPLAPILTQTFASTPPGPTAGTVVGNLSQPAWESDPGPFTYTLVGGSAVFALAGADITVKNDTDGAYFLSAKATTPAGVSGENGDTWIFADDQNMWDDTPDGYSDNPQIPPSLPADFETVPWTLFIERATLMLMPWARVGVDFVVNRPSKSEDLRNVRWNVAVLGLRPNAEIEALARKLASYSPHNKANR